MSAFMDSMSDWFKGKLSVTVCLLRIETTEWIFRLHYIWTTWLLILFTCMLCWKEWLGGHIRCLPIEEDTANVAVVPLKVIDTYCYVSSTFTIPFDPNSDVLAAAGPVKVSHSMLGGPQYLPNQNRSFHGYYQWVTYFLFFQAIMFQATMHIWTYYENRKISHLVQPLNERKLQIENESQLLKRLAEYLLTSRGEHFWWSTVYVLCEFGNFIVILFNIYLTDLFLGGEFSQYGFEVFKFLNQDPEDRFDPMAQVFPRITKCLFHMYGPSGSIQRFDTLCILTANIVNEKIFTFIWIWFIIVAVLTGAQVLYRIATLVSSRVRLMGLQIETFPINSQTVVVLERLHVSDWILLRFLRLNMESRKFQQLVTKLYDEILDI